MAYNQKVETFREEEYPMITGKTYLDHAGTTIYAKSLIDKFSGEMVGNLYGNPHSASAPAQLSGIIVDSNTYSLLDAAGLATTAQLDFSDPEAAPDFTVLSFYKIFGFPDLGALIVRRKSAHILTWRKYFGGGTVSSLTVLHEASYHRKDATIHDGLEDGTLPFHSIIALGCAIDVHRDLYGSMAKISSHTMFLTRRLYEGLSSLRHFNGRPVCEIYHDATNTHPYNDANTQGATIAFNILRPDGSYVSYSTVEQLANQKDIYVAPWHFKRAWSAGHRCSESENTEIINGKPTGVVRASLGAMSILSDVDIFLAFMLETFVEDLDLSLSGQTIIATAPTQHNSPIGKTQEFVSPVIVNGPGNWPIRKLLPINTEVKQNPRDRLLQRDEMYDYESNHDRPGTSHSTSYHSPVHHISTGSNDSAIVMSTEGKYWDEINQGGGYETWPPKWERRHSNGKDNENTKSDSRPTEQKGKKPEKTLSKAKSFWGLNKVVKVGARGDHRAGLHRSSGSVPSAWNDQFKFWWD
ncbi:hypothetical protein DID88_007530 [Monilinia fructigena]|uniref:Aminotransferase class V domain-containing protein n=1 Tax=Monilinia fructigena TaxID=38457 RepID=A0A395J2K4_9HELO|nr:hypothetical protein DID88_007530 [Monilinia fructigena]